MKKLLDSNLFVTVLIGLQLLFLVAGVIVAIYDGGHASIVPLILVFVVSFISNILLSLIAILLNSIKKWYYVGPLLIWVFLIAVLFFQNFEYEDDYEMEEEVKQMIYEEMQRDSIRMDSINKGNTY